MDLKDVAWHGRLSCTGKVNQLTYPMTIFCAQVWDQDLMTMREVRIHLLHTLSGHNSLRPATICPFSSTR
jgi:hypothetical protein